MIREKTREKVELGQFFTTKECWLKPQVREFIKNSKRDICYDPFAGGGDLLRTCEREFSFQEMIGLDIDEKLNWQVNDSLKGIPKIENAIVITNPPYMAHETASQNGIDLDRYFNKTEYDNIYLLALDKILDKQDKVVAIVPESFLHSNYKRKNLLSQITILEENPFLDTDMPVCVVCFDSVEKEYSEIKIYKNDIYIDTMQSIYALKMKATREIKIKFNVLDSWLGFRAIDSTDDKTKIRFGFKEDFDYDFENKISVNSRAFSVIEIDIPKEKREEFIDRCNGILREMREKSSDLILSPFKSNTKGGIRRRRLDFKQARAIMEKAYSDIQCNLMQ